MASKTIGTILTLKDQMSPKLFKVSSNVKNMSKDMQRASKQSVNMANKFTSSVNKMVGKAAKFAAIGAAAIATTGGAALIKQSDAYSGIQARLKLINDGQQTVDEFNKKIFDSADRARGNYQDMADIIGKLGITAGDAFKSNDEILQFSELMSKSFKVGGASAQEQSAAMYQLTQAMASGKLQGDEFSSISENAPMLAKAIADEMGVSMGQLKEMSSEGKITSDVIKSALFNSSDAINAQFAEMPLTFAEATTKIKNTITQKLAPAFEKLSGWLNSDEGKAAFDKVGDAVARVAEKVPALIDGVKLVFEGAKKLFEFIKKHQDVIIFIGTFVVALSGLMTVVSTVAGVFSALAGFAGLFGGAVAITTVGWIIAAIAALVAVGVLLYKNWDTVKAKTIEVWNIIKEKVSGAWQSIKAAFSRAGDFFAEVWEKVKAPFIAAAQWFNDTVIQPVVAIFSSIISKIGEIFSTIWQIIAALFGVAAQWFNDTVVQPLIGFFAPIVETIGGFFRGLWTGITEIFGSVVGWFSEKFTQAWEAIKAVFVPVGEFFAGVWETIKSMFTSIGTKIGEAVSGAFKTVVNAVLTFAESKINGFINGINAVVGMVNKLPGVSISRIAPLSIPKLAEGGIVTAPTLAMVGEGRENEAVIPLSKLDAMLSGKKERGGVTIGNITINARGVTADEVVREVVPKLKLALANI